MKANFSNYLKSSATIILVVASILFLSFSVNVRTLLSTPLVVHESNARGDACYVMAGGGAIWERLDAAADLIQMGRVSRIMLMQDNMQGQYSFKTNSSWTRTKWFADYLAWRGISQEKILWIPQAEGLFGTLTETRAVAKNLPINFKSLVIVSSAPHMRRSLLAFRRSLPVNINVTPYAATEFWNSYEMYHPIWLEYLKLTVYYLIA
ncbi:hypothetical protein OR1_04137 [Geobacter sp. OR-1]|uniref:YdcF family protein n=1 Tax=Geobacter sp. OR-1 TaxID=1266765 RepID=UPI000543C125|nr:YdcF family protein [Geobacter sp. OR-1]GAM11819.1 hypothetical protein OR1_04137 [Geobacter sp. OR-1]